MPHSVAAVVRAAHELAVGARAVLLQPGSGDICITYSQTGQPTVTAPNEEGIAWGQGYLSALHRFLPMEQQRRAAAARLSEIAGTETLNIDRWICRLGIPQAVEACYRRVKEDVHYCSILENYTNGVNYALEHQRKKCLGVEFKLFNYKPEPWTPIDSVRVLTLISWSLAGNWEEQLVRMQTLALLGPKQAVLLETESWLNLEKIEPNYLPLARNISSAFAHFTSTAQLLSDYQVIRRKAGLLPRRSGSNAWIVSGPYSESGKPILAGDPHMPLELPGVFYEMCFLSHDTAVNAIGVGIPGIPGLIIGRNAILAWTITVVGAITAELRLERVNENGKETTPCVHVIAVKGQADVVETVSWGARGPILQQLSSAPVEVTEQFNLSLEWTGHAGTDAGTLFGLWYMMQAKDQNALEIATARWGGPVLNLLCAEVEKIGGNYGWRIIGTIPRREDAQEGLLPALADQDEGQWAQGYIPVSQLPSEINPERGYLVSANHRMVPVDYPFLISHEYISSYRARRIEHLIQACLATKKYTVEEARHIQIDQTSEAALALRTIIMSNVDGQTKIQREALELLRRWDGALKANSAAAVILKLTEDYLYSGIAERLFAKQPEQQSAWLGTGFTPLNAGLMAHWRMRELFLALIMASPQELEIIPPESWSLLITNAFIQTIDELTQRFGQRPDLWRWGQLHKLELLHSLVHPPIFHNLSPLFRCLKVIFHLSRGPYELG